MIKQVNLESMISLEEKNKCGHCFKKYILFHRKINEYLTRLLEGEAFDEPCDEKEVKEDEFALPPWYDDELLKKGQRHYCQNEFGINTGMLSGLIVVLSVPSILRVLVHSRRSSSVFTAYRRYISTLLHTVSWHKEPFRPGSIAWESLRAVRSRHIRASRSAESSGVGLVSQRDLALTQFGFIGFSLASPHKLGLEEFEEGAWEGFVHLWKTIGYMIGLRDDYNLCRLNYKVTAAVCREMLQRVYVPCMTHVPEHFLHMTRVLLDGMWCANPNLRYDTFMYFTKNLCGLAGFEYTDRELAEGRTRLLHQIEEEKSKKTGAENRPTRIKRQGHHLGEPHITPKLELKPEHYDSRETLPAFRALSTWDRIMLHVMFYSHTVLYKTFLGRIYFNTQIIISHWLLRYFPYLAFYMFGISDAYVNIFVETRKDDTVPKKNSEILGIAS